jgi:hypothetical protein
MIHMVIVWVVTTVSVVDVSQCLDGIAAFIFGVGLYPCLKLKGLG